MGVDNSAGFRHLGKRPNTETLKLLVLVSNFKEPDWPDNFDSTTGLFTYYGDNRKAGELHETPRQGNLILKNIFDSAHSDEPLQSFPVILVFSNTGTYLDMRFIGLAVPSASGLSADEDLVAIWRTNKEVGERFQNYRAIFTILDVPTISRDWILDIQNGNAICSKHAPATWLNWLQNRKYSPLIAPPTVEIRTKQEQLPASAQDQENNKLYLF